MLYLSDLNRTIYDFCLHKIWNVDLHIFCVLSFNDVWIHAAFAFIAACADVDYNVDDVCVCRLL